MIHVNWNPNGKSETCCRTLQMFQGKFVRFIRESSLKFNSIAYLNHIAFKTDGSLCVGAHLYNAISPAVSSYSMHCRRFRRLRHLAAGCTFREKCQIRVSELASAINYSEEIIQERQRYFLITLLTRKCFYYLAFGSEGIFIFSSKQ